MSGRSADLDQAALVGVPPFDAPAPLSEHSGIAEPTVAATVRLAVAVSAALTIPVGAIAVVARLVFAAPARHWLAFPFTGVPADLHVAAGIFLHNLRALAAVGGLLLIAQSAYWGTHTAGSVHWALRRIGEGVLAAAVAVNVIVVGASLGAYGARMVRAVLPHGPVELAAYSLALALYLEGRRRPLRGRHVVAVLALSTAALAVAAVLETFVNV